MVGVHKLPISHEFAEIDMVGYFAFGEFHVIAEFLHPVIIEHHAPRKIIPLSMPRSAAFEQEVTEREQDVEDQKNSDDAPLQPLV